MPERSTSAIGTALLALLVVSVATAPSVSQCQRFWWNTSRQCQPWLWRPFQQFTQLAGCIAPVHAASVAPAYPVRDSTTSCRDRSASAGGCARRTGCCCVRSTCASGGVLCMVGRVCGASAHRMRSASAGSRVHLARPAVFVAPAPADACAWTLRCFGKARGCQQ